jgi:preprotein translocase subunit SecE
MANLVKFFREVRLESAKVTWPTRKETLQATLMVFVMVVLAALFFVIVDNIIGLGVRQILGFGR